MMAPTVNSSLQRRIEALETIASGAGGNIRLVLAKSGESAEQARQREGATDAESAIVVIFG